MKDLTILHRSTHSTYEPTALAPAPNSSPPAGSSLDRLMEGCERAPCRSDFARLVSATGQDPHTASHPRTAAPASKGQPAVPPAAARKLVAPRQEAVPSTFVPALRTVVSMPSLEKAILHARPDLPAKAVALLVAQSSVETGRFQHCYNYNLGNVKGKETEPHTHLRNTWEMMSLNQAQRAAASPLSHLCRFDPPLETLDPSNPQAKVRVTFQPPHPQTRFRAYTNLEDGAKAWLGFLDKLSARHPEVEATLREGDAVKYANALKHAGYFTASASAYGRALSKHLDLVTKERTP